MNPFPYRHILITGASSGIGAALALACARPGVTLSLTGRDETRLNNVAAACQAKGASVASARIDVTDRAALQDWIARRDREQAVDLAIANAGISGGGGNGLESIDQARRIFDVNIGGVFNTIGPALDGMLTRRQGQIALMSSLAGFRAWPGAPAYSASKAALRLYGEAIAPALAARGVTVSIICPGFVESAMTAVNPFPMPFLMDADRAAALILNGLMRRRARIAFPFPTYALSRLASVLPRSWLTRLPQKPESKDA